MKVLIVCYSLTGNTQRVSDIIEDGIKQYGHIVHTAIPKENKSIKGYDLVILGTFTWGQGEVPKVMKRYLRNIFVENQIDHYPQFAVFGTGDTQWGGVDLRNFCRAVDAISYYCDKYADRTPICTLKIEQSPMAHYQKESINKFVNDVLEGNKNENK